MFFILKTNVYKTEICLFARFGKRFWPYQPLNDKVFCFIMIEKYENHFSNYFTFSGLLFKIFSSTNKIFNGIQI